MTRAQAYTPAAPSRSHGEEIAAALLVVAIERAKALPVRPLRAYDGKSVDAHTLSSQSAGR